MNPLVYICADGTTLCAECAVKWESHPEDNYPPVEEWFEHDTDEVIPCDYCHKLIPSTHEGATA